MPTILFADGDRVLRDTYVELFSSHGLQVETARDGLECLAKLRRFVPDLLILDLELLWGGSDGVLAWLREERTLPALPVVVMASAGRGLDIEPPVVALLSKPFASPTLLASVCAALGLQRTEQWSPWDRVPACRSEIYIG